MTVAIKRENGDMIWMDAVVNFGRRFSGSVTRHPVETGAVITDHTIIDNEVINISGVISDADFNINRPVISEQDASSYSITRKQFVNNTPVNGQDTGAELYDNVKITNTSTWTKYLPDSIGQFVDSGVPEVDITYAEKVRLASDIQNQMIGMFNDAEMFSVVEFDGSRVKDIHDNCVMVSLNFEEDPESGDAIWPVITIERVKFAESIAVQVKKKVSPDVANASATRTNKGAQSTSPKSSAEDLGIKREQENVRRSSQAIKGQAQAEAR